MKNLNLRLWLGRLKEMPPARFFMLLGLAVAVVLAVDVFLILRPQLAGLGALDRRAQQIQADIDTIAASRQRMPQFKESLGAARRSMARIRGMVHQQDEMPALLKSISMLANEQGVKIDQLIPQKSDGVVIVKNEDGQYGSFSILVMARAGYHQLGRFLSRLEQDRVFWYLEHIDIAADPADRTCHVVKMQMKILTLGE